MVGQGAVHLFAMDREESFCERFVGERKRSQFAIRPNTRDPKGLRLHGVFSVGEPARGCHGRGFSSSEQSFSFLVLFLSIRRERGTITRTRTSRAHRRFAAAVANVANISILT